MERKLDKNQNTIVAFIYCKLGMKKAGTEIIECNRGTKDIKTVKQGCPLSQCLFNVFIQYIIILKEEIQDNFKFEDGSALIADSEGNMNKCHSEMQTWNKLRENQIIVMLGTNEIKYLYQNHKNLILD